MMLDRLPASNVTGDHGADIIALTRFDAIAVLMHPVVGEDSHMAGRAQLLDSRDISWIRHLIREPLKASFDHDFDSLQKLSHVLPAVEDLDNAKHAAGDV